MPGPMARLRKPNLAAVAKGGALSHNAMTIFAWGWHLLNYGEQYASNHYFLTHSEG